MNINATGFEKLADDLITAAVKIRLFLKLPALTSNQKKRIIAIIFEVEE